MSMPPYRPSAMVRWTWMVLLSLFGAGTGLMLAWYGGLLWVLMTMTAAERGPGRGPPDLLERLEMWLWPEGLVPLVLLGAVVGVALGVRRACLDDRSQDRWRRRAWQLGGGTAGAVAGVLIAMVLVGIWSVLTSGLDGQDPDSSPPSLAAQSKDVLVFGSLVAIPLAFSLIGSWLGAVLERRVVRDGATTLRVNWGGSQTPAHPSGGGRGPFAGPV